MEQLNAEHFRKIALENKSTQYMEKLNHVLDICGKTAKSGKLEFGYYDYIPKEVLEELINRDFKIEENHRVGEYNYYIKFS